MRYLAVDETQNLTFSETQQPVIASDECLIKVQAIGINRADLLQKAGKYPAPKGESEILGIEVSGTLETVGDDVTLWQPGQSVYALVPGGGYAEYVKVKATHLMALAAQNTATQGAAIAETFLTAYQSLFTIAKLQPGEKVLIHAGASGVGCAAIQLAKARGCMVVTTVGSDEKAKACKALGADTAINYKQKDFAAWAKENHCQFDVIVDVVAGDYVAKNINVAALDCRIVTLAILGGRFSQDFDMAKMLAKRISLFASTLRNRSDDYKATLVADFDRDFAASIADGSLQPVIDSVYSWQDANLAHQRMANNANIGKLVLEVD
ncbi:NAD(P)H-quinone oxidoreductase [Thalassotalea mangrovi]|uniref:NAD(P)H-quinone oxidoreductase n=1 Tax=Thalassotalea mangrovi TaxID=2572245 RepID=A0A4U1B766_9GAMM|nr:NAD(P)H-quinone oxidoreductase [Thalassotalea mangrovi]TKB46049.1 NAD(P)H-quinone oxidoreductase [Thalassotalea mangrovi]